MANNDRIEWAKTAPRADLATELMQYFGVNSSGGRIQLKCDDVEERLLGRAFTFNAKLTGPISEALQLLEHSELIYFASWTRDHSLPRWAATQLGVDTLASGKDAVRQRIRDRTGL